MTKAAIPTVVNTGNKTLDRAMAAIKQNLDEITGQAPRDAQQLQALPTDASLAETIALLNQIAERLR